MTPVWNDKLITREQAANLSGDWDLVIDNQDYNLTFLRCGICFGNVTRLPSDKMNFSVDALISAVVRHMCMVHDYRLSGAGNDDRRHDGQTAHDSGGDDCPCGSGHPVH